MRAGRLTCQQYIYKTRSQTQDRLHSPIRLVGRALVPGLRHVVHWHATTHAAGCIRVRIAAQALVLMLSGVSVWHMLDNGALLPDAAVALGPALAGAAAR